MTNNKNPFLTVLKLSSVIGLQCCFLNDAQPPKQQHKHNYFNNTSKAIS